MTVFPSRALDDLGRCCGRKPLFYKMASGWERKKDPHHFCCTCGAEFAPDGAQRANRLWRAVEGGFVPANTEGGNFKPEDWSDFFNVEPSKRQRWRFQRQQEIYRRMA